MNLVLSLFPGIDLFGRGFEQAGFYVVRGPDKIFGGDIYDFHAPAGKFEGVIGGPPCRLFSKANWTGRDAAEGMKLVKEFIRVVEEAQPAWFLLENVPEIPSVSACGYTVFRFPLNSNECGSLQDRNRHFQFGSLDGRIPMLKRARPSKNSTGQRTVLASEGKRRNRRQWADFCELQGLPRDFDLPGWSLAAKYQAVGNGVHVQVAYTIAQAILAAQVKPDARLCRCGCLRIIPTTCNKNKITATESCRSRYRYQKRASATEKSLSLSTES